MASTSSACLQHGERAGVAVRVHLAGAGQVDRVGRRCDWLHSASRSAGLGRARPAPGRRARRPRARRRRSTPWPPPSVSTATRGPRGAACCRSASSTSASSRGVRTWIAPAARQAAAITAASLVSEPVCDCAPRAAARARPGGEHHDRRAGVDGGGRRVDEAAAVAEVLDVHRDRCGRAGRPRRPRSARPGRRRPGCRARRSGRCPGRGRRAAGRARWRGCRSG